jgi:hypothetical protein
MNNKEQKAHELEFIKKYCKTLDIKCNGNYFAHIHNYKQYDFTDEPEIQYIIRYGYDNHIILYNKSYENY